jgi:aryl-alcohol dehydrogenase-like predicted oxidoreductase
MIYRTLGSTDLRVSGIGMGTVQLGMPYGLGKLDPPPQDEAIGLLRAAFERGVTYIDTAPGYGYSESLVGKAFGDMAEKPMIATKVNLPEETVTAGLEEQLEISLRNSLRELRLEHLELVQLHSIIGTFVNDELLRALENLQAKGLVKYWGVTTYGTEAPLDAQRFPECFRVLQVPYNMLDRSLDTVLFPQLEAHGMGLVLRSVFLQGVLSERYLALDSQLAPLKEAAQQLADLAKKSGMTLAQMALRFAAYSAAVHTTLFGTTMRTELEANCRIFEMGPLPEDLLSAIRAIEVTDRDLLNPGNWPS